MTNLKKLLVLIVFIFASILTVKSIIAINDTVVERNQIESYLWKIHGIPEWNIESISPVRYKKNYTDDFVHIMALNLYPSERYRLLLNYNEDAYTDSINDYPNEGKGERCRQVKYKLGNGEKRTCLVFFKNNKIDGVPTTIDSYSLNIYKNAID